MRGRREEGESPPGAYTEVEALDEDEDEEEEEGEEGEGRGLLSG